MDQRQQERDSFSKHPRIGKILAIFFAVVVATAFYCAFVLNMDGVTAMRVMLGNHAIIKDGHIMRDISHVIKYLPELESEDSIANFPYKAQIPDLIQEDIDRLLAGEAKDIVYQSKDGLYKLIISRAPQDAETDITITYQNLKDYPYEPYKELQTDFAIYATNGGIIVYGRDDLWDRTVSYYFVSENEAFQGYNNFKSMDLFGVNEEFEEIHVFNCDVTLTKNGNEFKFFQNGKQIGETFIFPGSDITVWDYRYLLDSNNDVYYMYYCADSENPWIHFTKVASAVDEVTQEVVKMDVIDSETLSTVTLKFNVYSKDGQKYIAIPDLETELAYGQEYGKHRRDSKFMNPDYSFKTVEFSDSKINKIGLRTQSFGVEERYFDWYAQYVYEVDSGWFVYTSKRIRGLDSEISSDIPKEEVQAFCDKSIEPEDYEETVKALKALYAKYE